MGEVLCLRRQGREGAIPVSIVSAINVCCRRDTTILFMISMARERLEAWNPVREKWEVSCATVMGVERYSLKSTPRIFVEVDGMGIEGLRTAVAAVAASPDFVMSFVCGFPCSSTDVEPFGRDLLDMELVFVPEIAAQKFPHFSWWHVHASQ